MKTTETCPLCGRDLDEHVYRDDDGRLWLIFWCDSCQCEFAAVGMDEFVALLDPSPIFAPYAEVDPDATT